MEKDGYIKIMSGFMTTQMLLIETMYEKYFIALNHG